MQRGSFRSCDELVMNAFAPNASWAPEIFLLATDHERLLDLICAAPRSTPGLTLLGQELERAAIVAPERAPSDLVQLRSIVTFTDLERGAQRTAQLVPSGQRTGSHRISVATPIGAALIGLRAGDTFRWRSPRGRLRTLRVDRVAPDPHAAERRQTRLDAARRRRIAELLSLPD